MYSALLYSVHNKIGFADMAPRFRQMPTSSYLAITLIPLIRKMIIQIFASRRKMILIVDHEEGDDNGGWFPFQYPSVDPIL